MATAKTSSSTVMTKAIVGPAPSKAAASSKGIREAGASERVASKSAAGGTKPVPKATRTLSAAFAALGDPRTLQVLGILSNGLSATTAGISAAYGMEAETATAAITSLKRQGWVEGSRVEGSRVEGSRTYTYKITESGSAAWGKAQGFSAI